MADPVHIGNVAFTEIEPHDRWTINQGWVKVRAWTGLITQVDAFLRTGLPNGYTSLDIERSAPAAKVTADYPWAGDPGDPADYRPDPITRSWQLVGTREEASIWSLPKVVKFWQTIPATMRGPLVRWINDCIDYGWSAQQAFPPVDVPPNATKANKAPNWLLAPFDIIDLNLFNDRTLANLYERLILSRDQYPVNRYVLRKVETIGNYSALKAAHSNVGRLLTLAQLRAAEPTLSQDVQMEITHAHLTKFYWYKNPPGSEPVQNGRKQITIEYEAYAFFDNWIFKKIGEAEDPIIDILTPL